MSIKARLARLEKHAGAGRPDLVYIVPRYDGETREDALAVYAHMRLRTDYDLVDFPQPGPRPKIPDPAWPKDHMSISWEELEAVLAHVRDQMRQLEAMETA